MDRYDRAVRLLRKTADRVEFLAAVNRAWLAPSDSPEGCLFAFLDRNPACGNGCLTQCKSSPFTDRGPTPAISERIQADERVPADPDDVTPENLDVFSEYQRLTDAALPGRAWSAYDARFPLEV